MGLTSDCMSSLWIWRSVDQYIVNSHTLMKFSGLCNPADAPFDLVEVWLEVGREGSTFTYSADQALGLKAGDLVRVRLRGRPLHGLVVSQRTPTQDSTVPGKVQAERPFSTAVSLGGLWMRVC